MYVHAAGLAVLHSVMPHLLLLLCQQPLPLQKLSLLLLPLPGLCHSSSLCTPVQQAAVLPVQPVKLACNLHVLAGRPTDGLLHTL